MPAQRGIVLGCSVRMGAKSLEVADHDSNWQEAAEPSRTIRWVQTWLTCVAFYYPIYWTSQFLLQAMPALVRVLVFGHRLKYFQATFFNVMAVSGPPNVSGDIPAAIRQAGHQAPVGSIPVVLAVAALLAVFGRRYRLLAGLGMAMLANLALLAPLWQLILRRRLGAWSLVESVLFFAVLSLGLRWMVDEVRTGGTSSRLGFLLAAFPLPLAAMAVLFALLRGMWIPRSWLLVAAFPGAVSAPLVGLLPRRHAASAAFPASWKASAVGLGITLLLTLAISMGGGALTQSVQAARLAENRAAMASLPKVSSDLPYPKVFFQKGVNFTAEFPDVYASEGARRMLEILPRYGVNAVALVPYGWSSPGNPVVRLNTGENSWESDEGVEEISRLAHARGIKVMLRPAVWNAIDLEFPSAGDRAKWFAQYGVFLEHYARLAKSIHADLFCVGGEFPKLSRYDAEWRKLIARVRELYPGPLVYAANFGEEFERLTFWDALDYIGLQEYYPLPDDLSTDSMVQKVEAVQRKFQRPVIFTEAGFPSHAQPNREPWNDAGKAEISPGAQARCYEAVFRAFYHKPWFQGVYWWKMGTNGFGGLEDASHTPWGKPAMDVVKRWYLEAGR